MRPLLFPAILILALFSLSAASEENTVLNKTPILPGSQVTDTVPVWLRIARGKQLFRNCCASCHKLTKDFTGPALAGATKRYSREWLYRFIRNPAAMIENDPQAKVLAKKWRPTVMTAFSLSRSNIDDIFTYIENRVRLDCQKQVEVVVCE